ncbi:MAG: ATP-binding cassette domain-containing protein, partial [Erysipelotrichaceae bacterium]|nr:ATP-binding cassette domain-containing protein [Erysipelotrichaceae bacterium]
IMMTTQGILTTAVITVMVFCFDWRVGLIILAGVALFGAFNVLMQLSAKRSAPRKAVADEALVSAVIEYVQGIAEVKNFNLTGSQAKKLARAIREKCKGDTFLEFSVIPFMTLQNITTKLIGILMCIASVKFYFAGTMELLYAVMMTVSSFLIYESLELMGNFSALLRTIDIAVTQAQGVLSEPAMDISGEDISPKNHDIELSHVGFAYESRRIIDDVSLRIPEKTTTAIVGPSGGGKTTICHLLPKFYHPQSGVISIDGNDIEDITMQSLRENIGIVQQDVFLFSGSFADNIAYGKKDATMDEIIEAAKKANIYDYILSLPEGFDTEIGERGIRLSGGQKQRLSIARVFLKNPSILILDEATSALDNTTEALIQEALNSLKKGRTTIVVAHRLSTIKNADEILVVANGKIRESGTHDELLRKDEGIYKKLYESQFLDSDFGIDSKMMMS